MKLILISIVLILSSCQTARRPVKISRKIQQYQPKNQNLVKNSRKLENSLETSPIFIKKKKLKIKKVEKINSEGSLFFADNPDNYLFYDMDQDRIGDVIKVLVQSSQADPNVAQQEEADPEKLQDELITALPKFAPQDGLGPLPITSINFKIDRKLPNGDLIVSYYRTSKNETQSSLVRVQGRIPKLAIMKETPVTTKDLLDIDWYERADDEVIERDSLSWHDEYTLRLSGFAEAKTKYAQDIEEKEKALKEVSQKLRERIELVGQERQKIAQSRQDLEKNQAKINERLDGINKQLEGQKDQIEEQKSIIKEQKEQLDQQLNSESSGDQSEGAAND